MKHKISLVPSGAEVQAEDGATLLEALRGSGVHLDAPCGGKGTCGKCTVEICGADGVWQTVRACRTAVREDLRLRVPAQAQDIRVLTESRETSDHRSDPWIRREAVSVRPCRLGEKTSAWARLEEALGRDCPPEIPAAAELGTLADGRAWVISSPRRVLCVCAEEPRVYMAAFDIGTTTIAGYLLGADGEILARDGMLNPQTEYGADVISRVEHCMAHGTEELTRIVRAAVDALLGRLCAQAGAERGEVYAVSIVGNTCMHHLFLGLTPVSLGKAPFSAVVSRGMTLRCADYGLSAHPQAELILLPVIAGFIGADTVGCAVAESFDTLERRTLLIDIGTNGELIMGTRARMVACSTAAGPAFEGAKIRMGMRGARGAIDHVSLDADGGVCAHVIGGGEAKGICGSGLIDAAAVLLKAGIMDEMGALEGGSYTFPGTPVTLYQKDVREIQLAKAAICAGIRLMASRLGWRLEEIERVCVAGAFGNTMNAESACDIGLIPEELRGRIEGVGNAAGAGAVRVLADRQWLARADALARRVEFLELATLREFQDAFVDALPFGDWEG